MGRGPLAPTCIFYFARGSPLILLGPRGAGDGNRTRVACLEGRGSTIELHPQGCGLQPTSGRMASGWNDREHAAWGRREALEVRYAFRALRLRISAVPESTAARRP